MQLVKVSTLKHNGVCIHGDAQVPNEHQCNGGTTQNYLV